MTCNTNSCSHLSVKYTNNNLTKYSTLLNDTQKVDELQKRSSDVPHLCNATAVGYFLPSRCCNDCSVFSGDNPISLELLTKTDQFNFTFKACHVLYIWNSCGCANLKNAVRRGFVCCFSVLERNWISGLQYIYKCYQNIGTFQ